MAADHLLTNSAMVLLSHLQCIHLVAQAHALTSLGPVWEGLAPWYQDPGLHDIFALCEGHSCYPGVYIDHGKHLLYLAAVIDVEEDTSHFGGSDVKNIHLSPSVLQLKCWHSSMACCIWLEFDSELKAPHIL